ncbi:MAG: serine hydrolase [bacterium]|nr:serine hydrolase [bacterium]
MAKVSLHTAGISFLLRLMAVVAVIFLTGNFLAAKVPDFLAEQGIFNTPELTVAVWKNSLAKKVPIDTFIYSHRAEAEAKRDALIAAKSDFVAADVAGGEVALYEKGEAVKKFPIVSTGALGSFFEIPSGLYHVSLKEEKHSSAIADGVFPWTLNLFGNYFIHGAPILRRQAAIGHAGGIQLATSDAKALFARASTTIPVVVIADGDSSPANENYFQKIPLKGKNQAVIPGLTAYSVLAADIETGQILFQKNTQTTRPIASVTKLMTALIATEKIVPDQPLIVNERAVSTSGDTGKLRVGDRFKAKDLLYPLLLSSSNDAAVLYEQQVKDFVNLMNDKAHTLGLASTSYKDATGLRPENVSTVQDLFALLTYIYRQQRELFTLSSLPQYAVIADNKLHAWRNSTWPDNDGIFLGGKFGYTPEARQTLAAVFGVTVSEHNARPIAIVLLGSNDRKRDATLVMNYVRKQFAYGATLKREKTPAMSQDIYLGANIFEALRRQ